MLERFGLVSSLVIDRVAMGSIGALAAKLNSDGPRPKPRQLANGRSVQAECWRVGPLAHILKNRFYIGEIAYQGEVNQGEHKPILDRDLFEAVQAKLKDQAVCRKLARRQSPHLLTAKLFDDRGNPMSPTHANKKGVRYRYYASQALLQRRTSEAGSVTRVAAAEVERLVSDALRAKCDADAELADRDLIERYLARAEIRRDAIAITIATEADSEVAPTSEIVVTFTPTTLPAKGVKHAPAASGVLNEADRISILTIIARSKAWIDQLLRDPSIDFAVLAERENLAERHVRFLAPLAYLSPRIIEAITEGRASAGLAVRRLAKNLPLAWAEQEASLKL